MVGIKKAVITILRGDLESFSAPYAEESESESECEHTGDCSSTLKWFRRWKLVLYDSLLVLEQIIRFILYLAFLVLLFDSVYLPE